MKKICLLLFMILLLCSCNKKDEAKNINELISYDILDYFEKDNYNYVNDGDKTYIESYYSTKNEGFFQAQIFSYKNKDVFNPNEDYSLDENDYIGSLTNLVEMKIDKENFFIGYRGSEEVDNASLVAYVRHKNYVFEFDLSNSEQPISEEQYNDFLVIIQSVKFKY